MTPVSAITILGEMPSQGLNGFCLLRVIFSPVNRGLGRVSVNLVAASLETIERLHAEAGLSVYFERVRVIAGVQSQKINRGMIGCTFILMLFPPLPDIRLAFLVGCPVLNQDK